MPSADTQATSQSSRLSDIFDVATIVSSLFHDVKIKQGIISYLKHAQINTHTYLLLFPIVVKSTSARSRLFYYDTKNNVNEPSSRTTLIVSTRVHRQTIYVRFAYQHPRANTRSISKKGLRCEFRSPDASRSVLSGRTALGHHYVSFDATNPRDRARMCSISAAAAAIFV